MHIRWGGTRVEQRGRAGQKIAGSTETRTTSISRAIRGFIAMVLVLGVCGLTADRGAEAAAGLTAGYALDAGSGASAVDSSGNGLTGSLVGATWVTGGRYGGGLGFNGSSQYVDVGDPTALRLTGSATWSVWVMAAGTPADDGQIIAKSNDSVGWQFKTSPDTGPHRFAIGVTGPGNSWVQRNSITVRALNTWYHVAGVYNVSARTLDVYVNGVLDNGILHGTVPSSMLNPSVNVNIGRRTGGYHFNGIIDEVRVYNRALTAAEIQADMTTPLGAAVADTQAPTAPGDPTLTVVGATRIDLAWAAATDNVAVTGYRVERCQNTGCSTYTQIATPTTTTYSNTALNPATTYSYRIRAIDAAGNLSPYTTTTTATTTPSEPASSPPVVVAETHSATDGCCGPQYNNATLTLNVTGTDRLLIVAWHSEWDGVPGEAPTPPDPDAWSVSNNGVPGTVIADTNGYTGGDGNRRFRIYYWLNPPEGLNTVQVSNPNTGPNELSVSAVLFNNVDQTNPLGDVVLDISTQDRSTESETVRTQPGDLVVHVIADALRVTGTLGDGETSQSRANDGLKIDGDASIWISTKPADQPATTVSSSGWANRVLNGVGIVLHGL